MCVHPHNTRTCVKWLIAWQPPINARCQLNMEWTIVLCTHDCNDSTAMSFLGYSIIQICYLNYPLTSKLPRSCINSICIIWFNNKIQENLSKDSLSTPYHINNPPPLTLPLAVPGYRITLVGNHLKLQRSPTLFSSNVISLV